MSCAGRLMQIHDEVFPRLASGQLPENSNALPRLLGVTNLYFLKALPNWPNVLSTGKRTVLQRSVSDGGLQVILALPFPHILALNKHTRPACWRLCQLFTASNLS